MDLINLLLLITGSITLLLGLSVGYFFLSDNKKVFISKSKWEETRLGYLKLEEIKRNSSMYFKELPHLNPVHRYLMGEICSTQAANEYVKAIEIELVKTSGVMVSRWNNLVKENSTLKATIKLVQNHEEEVLNAENS